MSKKIESLVFNGKTYIDLEDIKELFPEILKHIQSKEILKNTPISLRKAMMITMEKKIELESILRKKLEYNNIRNQSKVEFVLGNRNITRFKTLDDIHPENPCCKYEDLGMQKHHYKRAINFICTNEDWLLKEKKLTSKFNSIKEDVELC